MNKILRKLAICKQSSGGEIRLYKENEGINLRFHWITFPAHNNVKQRNAEIYLLLYVQGLELIELDQKRGIIPAGGKKRTSNFVQ